MAEEKTQAEPKKRAKPKKKVWLVKAVKTQKACFEAGEGKKMTRKEYDFKVEGWKDPVTKEKADGRYVMDNEDHVKKLSSPGNKIIEVYDTKEV